MAFLLDSQKPPTQRAVLVVVLAEGQRGDGLGEFVAEVEAVAGVERGIEWK